MSSTLRHKIDWGPGYRLFCCPNCNHRWQERSRHCESQSGEFCPECSEEFVRPDGCEPHYEWPTDGSGNLRGDDHT